MREKRIVITGIGVISPIGIGRDNFWQALKEGRSGIKPISRQDISSFKTKLAGEISDFKAADYLGTKGLKELNRSTRFLCSAAKFAVEDAKLSINAENTDEIGVCTGTTLSSLWNIAEFDKEVIQEGPLFTDVALFPGTVVNAASSQVSIRHNIQGFNTTISTGYTSSIDALRYASDFIRLGRVKAVLVGAVESISMANLIGFYNLGFLAGIKGEEISCPFDQRRNGIILSEGAAVIVLEDEDYAKKRNAPVYAEVKGTGDYFDAYKMGKYQLEARGLRESMLRAIKSSGLKVGDIDCISAAANSVPQQDKLETKAIKDVFGKLSAKIPVTAIKSMIGEPFSAAGMLQICACLGYLKQNFVSPTINYKVKDPECDLDYVPNKPRDGKFKNILVNNYGPGGNNASAVVSRYQ